MERRKGIGQIPKGQKGVRMDRTRKRELGRKWLLACIVFTFGGVFGFIYEELFYRIDLGYFVKRGSGIGPWIFIYAGGAFLIFWMTERIPKNALTLFLFSALLCGGLELATGFILHHFFGIRLWDYNVEIWNFGNIGGYICARSVLLFGFCGVFLRLIAVPLFERFLDSVSIKTAIWVSVGPAVVSALDMLIGMILRAGKL